MAKHIHIHIHRPTARTRDASKPDPDREALVAALMEAIRAREGKTKDADFKEEDHPRDHGKFTSAGSSGPSGPKPTSATAKGSKAAVHELLSSGHRFSVDELMKATGCSSKSTLMTALADLKNPKYAGKLGALKIEKHADGGYHVVKDEGKKGPFTPGMENRPAFKGLVRALGRDLPSDGTPTPLPPALVREAAEAKSRLARGISIRKVDGKWAVPDPDEGKKELPIHPDLLAVTRPGAPVPGSGKKPTKAEEEDMATRAGEPRAGVPRTVPEFKKKVADTPKQATSKAVHDPVEGTHHVVTLPSGAVHKIQRLNATESMGVPGFHVISGKEGWRGSSPTYLGDTKQEAIRALQDRESRRK